MNARKFHYYAADHRSLCGKYVILGGSGEPDTGPCPDDCAACRRKLIKLTARAAELAGDRTHG